MRKELLPSIILTVLCILFFSGLYPLVMWGIAQAAPNKGEGFITNVGDKTYYNNIAQKFSDDKYFWSRPSAVDYNAAGSAGSNKGPANPDYLAQVQQRIDTFLAHNPGVRKSDIPSDMVTASGSGLDPHISPQGAMIQINRIANARHLPIETVKALVDKQTEKPLLGLFGPKKINVLKLNIELDHLK
ncbi:MAG: K(+)-transporting ATPase subunit C [Bacteroidetes bacterium]|nr:K(+)-transporting ATPase subunit C [Bacteroidota bacterium]